MSWRQKSLSTIELGKNVLARTTFEPNTMVYSCTCLQHQFNNMLLFLYTQAKLLKNVKFDVERYSNNTKGHNMCRLDGHIKNNSFNYTNICPGTTYSVYLGWLYLIFPKRLQSAFYRLQFCIREGFPSSTFRILSAHHLSTLRKINQVFPCNRLASSSGK
jgi:hypothetical protein